MKGLIFTYLITGPGVSSSLFCPFYGFLAYVARKEIGGMTLKRQRGLLYMAEGDAAVSSDNESEALPVVHVLQLVP